MKNTSYLKLLFVCALTGILYLFSNCSNAPKKAEASEDKDDVAAKLMDVQSPVERGRYLVTMGGCDDCHSPKIMTDHGPAVDSTRRLSGHPEGSPSPQYHKEDLKPGGVFMCSQDLTQWMGPWGTSYTFNLTPDKETGTGSWTPELFIKILRSGKHMGGDAARPILPPMPWQNFAQLSDDDLKAIFAFLQSLPAVKNKIPDPLPPAI